MRKTQWHFAWNLTQQHPWTGWGLRNFLKLYKAETHLGLGHPHNLFLMLSAETGIPATLLFCGLIAWVVIAAIKVLQKPQFLAQEDRLIFFSYVLVLLGWVLFNMVDVTIYDFRLNTLFWLILSAVCGLVYRYNQDGRIQSQQDERIG